MRIASSSSSCTLVVRVDSPMTKLYFVGGKVSVFYYY